MSSLKSFFHNMANRKMKNFPFCSLPLFSSEFFFSSSVIIEANRERFSIAWKDFFFRDESNENAWIQNFVCGALKVSIQKSFLCSRWRMNEVSVATLEEFQDVLEDDVTRVSWTIFKTFLMTKNFFERVRQIFLNLFANEILMRSWQSRKPG